VAVGLGTDRGQDRSGQVVGGGSDGGFVIGGHDRPGTSIGNSGLLAVAWCGGIAAVSYLLSMRLYERHSVH
jgi:hypothetical protein